MATLHGGPAVAIREELALSELPAFFARAFSLLGAAAGAKAAGPPFARYHRVSGGTVDVEATMPISEPVPVTSPVALIQLGGGPAVQIEHIGPYDDLHATYATLDRWLAEHHAQRAEAVREVYLTSPAEVPDPAQWITVVVQPITAIV